MKSFRKHLIVLLCLVSGCGNPEPVPEPVVAAPEPDAKPRVVDERKVPHPEIDNFVAACAESTMEVLSKGMKDCRGDIHKKINAGNVVWFSYQDSIVRFHLIPRGQKKNSGSTWYPMRGKFPVKYSVAFKGDVEPVSPEMLNNSSLVQELMREHGDLGAFSEGLRICFSCKPEGTTPNLYHYTLYFYFMPESEWAKLGNKLPDMVNLSSRKNGFLHKFDFLIGRAG